MLAWREDMHRACSIIANETKMAPAPHAALSSTFKFAAAGRPFQACSGEIGAVLPVD